VYIAGSHHHHYTIPLRHLLIPRPPNTIQAIYNSSLAVKTAYEQLLALTTNFLLNLRARVIIEPNAISTADLAFTPEVLGSRCTHRTAKSVVVVFFDFWLRWRLDNIRQRGERVRSENGGFKQT
jgi:hypothetical protein